MSSLLRLLVITHVFCRYRLVSLLPRRHAATRLLWLLQWITPSCWLGVPGTKGLSEGERLRLALERLGPIFIKMGQLLATRRDLLPANWTDALTRLQDQVAPFPVAQAVARIEQELGRPVTDVFSRFDMKPLASASVAQVHTACLEGKEVVLKVLRPGIEKRVEQDIRLLTLAARLAERFWADAALFHPARIIADYADIIRGELDLELEAANTETTRRNFLFSPLLYVPHIYAELSSSKVMVMERIYGLPVNDIAHIKAAGIDPKQMAETGVHIFLTQVFRHNFFHADMHPGNIFINPARPDSPQFMSIDCAIYGHLSERDLLLLGRLVLSVVRRDYATLVDLVVRAGWCAPDIDRYRFEQRLKRLVDPLLSQTMANLEFAPLVVKLLDTAREYHVEAPTQYMLLLKTLIHVEGLGQQIYPELDIWATAKPFLETWMLERFGPVATLKKLQERLPEWIAQLPDMPDTLREALEAMRQPVPRPTSRTAQSSVSQLTSQLARHRRKVLGGIAGLGLITTPVFMVTAPSWIPILGGVLIVWAWLG
jgi:ubiquinone biosynthesis protein